MINHNCQIECKTLYYTIQNGNPPKAVTYTLLLIFEVSLCTLQSVVKN